jgi:hypothetical protein
MFKRIIIKKKDFRIGDLIGGLYGIYKMMY